MSDRYRTTSKHFDIFKKEAFLWIGKFNLGCWGIGFFHTDTSDGELNRAWLSVQYSHQLASIGLTRNWGNNAVTVHKVKRAAFHEVFHLMLANLMIMGQDRWANQDTIEAEEHSVIRRMENLFYGREESQAKV